jgi:predicted DNA-binding transcriptional regulator AlpA
MNDKTDRATSPVLWDVRRVAEHFGCNVSTIWRWDKARQIPAPLRVGGTVRWRREDIERFTSGQSAA